MRSIWKRWLVAAVGAGLAGCSAARGANDARVLPEAGGAPPALAAAPSDSAPRAPGPMDVEALARELGLRAEAAGPGVLLSNADLRARVFPGSDRMSVDGRTVTMGEPVRSAGGTLLVPAAGVDALRSAVADGARRRQARARIPAPTIVPVVAPGVRAPEPVVLSPVSSGSSRPSAAGDPSWVPMVAERSWKYVVVHHSDDTSGGCAKYDSVHRGKGWENGCGYHFVIGNGTQSGDGEIEIGPRWTRQIQGAHAKTADNRFNEAGVGIVLVGDFERGGRPTARQYEALVRLTRWLRARYGIGPEAVLRHSDCKSTACPGKFFPWARYVADAAR